MKLNEYMKIGEAAEFMGVTKNTLRNWEDAGKIKSYRNKMNNYRLYKREELNKFRESIINLIIPACKVNINDLI